MAFSVFPTSLDNFINPLAAPNYVWRDGSIRSAPGVGAVLITPANPQLAHTYQQSLKNEAIAALQAKVGINGSADSTSIDFKINNNLIKKNGTTVTTATIPFAAGTNVNYAIAPDGVSTAGFLNWIDLRDGGVSYANLSMQFGFVGFQAPTGIFIGPSIANVILLAGSTVSYTGTGGHAFSSDVTTAGSVKTLVAGGGLFIKEGSNAMMGTDVLSSGNVTVNNTKPTANSRIFVQRTSVNGRVGYLVVENVVPGTSFDVNSYDATGAIEATDKSEFNWLIVEPS